MHSSIDPSLRRRHSRTDNNNRTEGYARGNGEEQRKTPHRTALRRRRPAGLVRTGSRKQYQAGAAATAATAAVTAATAAVTAATADTAAIAVAVAAAVLILKHSTAKALASR